MRNACGRQELFVVDKIVANKTALSSEECSVREMKYLSVPASVTCVGSESVYSTCDLTSAVNASLT